jgi:hypothetical protein
VEVVLLGDDAAVVDFDLDEVGIDAVDGSAEGLEEQGIVRRVYPGASVVACDGCRSSGLYM